MRFPNLDLPSTTLLRTFSVCLQRSDTLLKFASKGLNMFDKAVIVV